MKVKLTRHIMEGNNLKCSVRVEKVVPFIKGAVVDVSDATGDKWIKRGWAEECKDETKPDETAETEEAEHTPEPVPTPKKNKK